LFLVEKEGLAGATVDARIARMGEGLSSYHDGVISAANALAKAAGVEVGMTAAEAATWLLQRP
jgi:nucleotidyltransferase/DNA polymerase involved in DNA repair